MRIQDLGLLIFKYKWDIFSELSKIRKYYDQVEVFFTKESVRIEKEFESQTERYNLLSANQRHELIEKYGWELTSNQSAFPEMLRGSVLISIYNLMEHQLNNVCHGFEYSSASKIKLNDLNGKGIERARIFLIKIADIDFSSLNTQWEFIKSLNLIRNNIVHSGTILPPDKNHKLNKFIDSHPGLRRGSNGELIINEGFIQQTIDIIMDFFNSLFKLIFKKST